MIGLEQYADTYEILGKLGEGSGGVVYRAFHKRLKKDVVLKKMRTGYGRYLDRRQEVDILKNLNHSYLPQVYDFLLDGEDVYTVMSYVPGRSLQQVMDGGEWISGNRLRRWALQLCSALSYLHSQRPPIIHSDIKPANIMLTPNDDICLIDFNISFFLDDGTVLGYSQGYTSPEQYIVVWNKKTGQMVKNCHTINEKTDIYSVGATFYYLATGECRNDYRVPLNYKLLLERTSDAFAQVIARAMEIDPERRYVSAVQMYRAFEQIPKQDKRYRAMLRRQTGIRMGLVALMAGFIVLSGYGFHEMRLEKVERYNKAVEEQVKAIEDGKYDKAENKYRKAIKILPGAYESYYQNAKLLHEQEKYTDCIEFIDYDMLDNEKLHMEEEQLSQIYYLKADSFFQLGEYEESVAAYEELFHHGGFDALFYRDYAIALAYAGRHERADEVLDKAIEYGLGEDSVYYAGGEVKKALGEIESSIADFRECIAQTSDDSLKARAYLLLSELYRDSNRRMEEQEVLSEALEVLPVNHQMLLIERLIQVDMDLADSTGTEEYRMEAIQKLQTVIEQGWDTENTYNNLAILYEKQNVLSQAEDILQQMKAKFGEDYILFKRYAFLEIDRQNMLDNSMRNYSQFAEYYQHAMELFEKENIEDSEMQLLKQTYEQVKAGGWL